METTIEETEREEMEELKTKDGATCPVERGVRHPCQRMKGIIHKTACRSGKKTKAYKIMADREAYTLINVKVYLCPKCAEEMGV